MRCSINPNPRENILEPIQQAQGSEKKLFTRTLRPSEFIIEFVSLAKHVMHHYYTHVHQTYQRDAILPQQLISNRLWDVLISDWDCFDFGAKAVRFSPRFSPWPLWDYFVFLINCVCQDPLGSGLTCQGHAHLGMVLSGLAQLWLCGQTHGALNLLGESGVKTPLECCPCHTHRQAH